MTGLLRFGIKAGILGGAIYYSKQIGVWDDSTRTYSLTREITTYVKPYLKSGINSVQKELPIQVSELPSSDDICRTLISYWNKSVITSINFIQKLPGMVSCYVSQGVVYLRNEIQKEKKNSSIENENS